MFRRSILPVSLLTLGLLAPRGAAAAELLSGDLVQIGYDDNGNWNDPASGVGVQLLVGGADWVDFTYPGTPFQQLTLAWTQDGLDNEVWATADFSGDTLVADSATDASSGSLLSAVHSYAAGDLVVTKTESWEVTGSVVLVEISVVNRGSTDATDLRVFFGADPDQEFDTYGSYDTNNNVQDVDGDGHRDYVESVGDSSGWTLAFGACDAVNTELGHYEAWYEDYTDADVTLTDDAAATEDYAMGIRYTAPSSLAAGDTLVTSFLVLLSEKESGAQALYEGAVGACPSCDADEDGFIDERCFGDDCDDSDPLVYPGAVEVWYDGVDGDCAGDDDLDQDGDGSVSDAHGGEDCDDTDAGVNLGAEEVWYDGVDQNCDGNDADQDGDGYEADAVGGPDCDDLDFAVNPAAEDDWYDGEDTDCAGDDDFDQDGDGYAAEDYGGDDCDDLDPARSPGAAEAWYDGEDQDCDGADDFDQDGDGVAVTEDCDDTDPALSAEADCANADGSGDGGDGSDGSDGGGGDGGGGDGGAGGGAGGGKGGCSVTPAPASALGALAGLLLLLAPRRRSAGALRR